MLFEVKMRVLSLGFGLLGVCRKKTKKVINIYYVLQKKLRRKNKDQSDDEDEKRKMMEMLQVRLIRILFYDNFFALFVLLKRAFNPIFEKNRGKILKNKFTNMASLQFLQLVKLRKSKEKVFFLESKFVQSCFK